MASGYSRVQLFNPVGILIDEIDVPTVRSWVLNSQTTQPGRCQFTVPVYAATGGFNPKCTQANFQYGNFVLIRHVPSKNADGTTNGLLPDWVGIILAPQVWEYGKLTVTAYSAEQVFAYRAFFPFGAGPEQGSIGGPGGGAFTDILKSANSQGGIPIQPGVIDTGGVLSRYFPVQSCYDAIQFTSKQTGCDWDVTPQLSASNQLTLLGNWYAHKGIPSGQVLSNLTLQSESPMYTEQGTFYNSIIGISDDYTHGTRNYAFAQDQASIAVNGVLSINVIFPGTGGAAHDVIQGLTNAYLAANLHPTRTFAPVLLDVGNAFSFAACGNTWLVQNDTVSFQNGGIGIDGSIRITAVEYSELTNAVTMAGVLQ